jgi:response regulator RpfG family c-di-GMP phosphodiesterase
MMRVLIVDDERPIRRLLTTWSQAEGATVLEAESAEQAVSLVEAEGPPDVALCDVRLPGKDGLWLAEYFRTTSPQTAVVMTTAVHEFDSAVNSLQAGVVDYLCKPYGTERFVSALKNAFVVHQSRRAQAAMEKELTERRAQVTEALAELEVNANSALNAMLAMLHARDSISYDHAHRVAKLAVDLAMMLEIGEPQLSDIERAALLHNLGRLAMPDTLLHLDESALSESDREKLRSYPLHGHAMLKNVPMLTAANQIAVATHERFDGSGFPHGLRGQQIPVGARIIAVADAYDELFSGIGHDAVSVGRAIEILTTERQSQFDSNVLSALKTLQPTPERVS